VKSNPPSTSLSPSSLTPEIDAVVKTAFRIRSFERALLGLFERGLLSGTVHTCVGQELCAAALHPHLRTGVDAFFATHRGHGHYLAYGGPEDQLLAELMGRQGALCLGRGGTQNLFFKRFFSSGIQGGSAPIGVGFAWAMKRRGEDAIAVVQIGDGTLGEGTLYEAFTFAALLAVPVLFLLEWNGWAQSTDVNKTTPGDIVVRATGFGLEAYVASDQDPVALYEQLGRVVETVRRGRPALQVIQTRRLLAHSKGDDNRPADIVAALWRSDPLTRLAAEVERCSPAETTAEREIAVLVQTVGSRSKLEDVGVSALPPARQVIDSTELHADVPGRGPYGRVAEELNASLHELLASHAEVLLVGQDVLDPYGGAFKVSRGLSTKYPAQVFSTPVAEAGIVGLSNGLALAGCRPVAEIMFADFVTLATDQLVNFAAKFHYMSGGRVLCPLTLRLVSGGGRGYGPTHSQSLERLFCGIPGLRVIALSHRHHPGRLLGKAILGDDGPTVFVENKTLYAQRPASTPPPDTKIVLVQKTDGAFPPLFYASSSRTADVTLVTYGGMTFPCESAMAALFEEQELAFDYLVLTQLWPLDLHEVVQSVGRTKRLVVVEESVADYGVSAAVMAHVAQSIPGVIGRTVGAKPLPIPGARHLEDKVLPSEADVREAILALVS
jgi:2-oxoisovalerate dehydrogenase E1 component